MSIEFAPLDTAQYDGSARLTFRLKVQALSDVPAGSGVCTVPLTLGLLAQGDSQGQAEDPDVPGAARVTLSLGVQAQGHTVADGAADVTLSVGTFSTDGVFANVPLRLDVNAWAPPPDGYPYFFLSEAPPWMYGTGGAWYTDMEEGLRLGADVDTVVIALVQSILRLEAAPLPLMIFAETVQDNLVMREAVSLIFAREVLSDITLASDTEALLTQVVAVVDQLLLQDEYLPVQSALVTVLAALALRDTAVPVLQQEVQAALALDEEVTRALLAAVEVISDLALADEAPHSAVMFALVASDMEVLSQVGLNLVALVELLDNLELGVRLRVGKEVYAGYVVNLARGAVTEYENYNFNSLAMIGGKPFGAGEEGVYLLQGDDDDGAPIDAYVRTGALNFGSLTKVLNGYIGVKADGTVLMKVITRDGGVKKENWYRMKRRPTGETVETRFDIAKGLTSTYWQWELANEDGAYFELDFVKVWPLRLTRRYSGR